MTAAFDWVLFDLDGTVWDSAPGIVDALVHTLDRLGLPPRARHELESNLGPPLLEMLAEVGVPEERLEEAKDEYRARYRTHGEFQAPLYDGMAELLDALRGAGVRLATATSKGIEPTRRMLDHSGLGPSFDVVAAASMDASAHHKVDVIARALSEADVNPGERVAMVGDRHYDISGGRQFSLTTIGVEWGYGGPGELADHGADHIVADVAELAAVLGVDVGEVHQ